MRGTSTSLRGAVEGVSWRQGGEDTETYVVLARGNAGWWREG